MLISFYDSSWFNVLFFVLLFIFILSGILHANRYKRRNKWEVSGIENAVVGIFALIISFTFLQAGNMHRERYANIHQQANNIDALYRYSKEMPDSFYRQTKTFLILFLDNQFNYKKISDEAFLLNAENITDNYWSYLEEYKRKTTSFVYADELNKISSSYEGIKTSFLLNVYSYNERTPSLIMFLLIITSLLIGFLVGFMNGIKSRIHYIVPLIYFVMITLTIMVITDLNNPTKGLIKPGYQHLRTTFEHIKNA